MSPHTRFLAFVLAVLLTLGNGCTPQDVIGSSDRGTGGTGGTGGKDDAGGDDGNDDSAPATTFTFTISGSATDPYLAYGPPRDGAYDLYLWLVCAPSGLSQVQADFTIEGDALVPDHFFSPEGSAISIVWQEYGELNLAVSDCIEGETMLGRLHLNGFGEGVRLSMAQPAIDLGAIGCGADQDVHGFSCVGYASDGTMPPQTLSDDGCAPTVSSSGPLFAISASPVVANQQSAPPVDGPVQLFVWSLGASFSALQANIEVTGGTGELDPVFAAQPPYLSINTPGGPDVLLASPGCSSGTKLLGSIWVMDDGQGVWVTMTPGAGGGGYADCGATPATHHFTCRPFNSRS